MNKLLINQSVAPIVLASQSKVRADILRRAGLDFHIEPAHIDEEMIREGMELENAPSAHIAETLAEMKAIRVSTLLNNRGAGDAFVIGADQVLDLKGIRFDKPRDLDQAKAHLKAFSGKTHQLISATVIARHGAPIWRHVGRATMAVRELSDDFINAYVDHEKDHICQSVGAYFVEGLGVHLFSEMLGDQSTIQGLPIIPLLDFLRANEVVL
ncbi:MAG: Maf family protein [Alphaproteobacteria bacterium]